jgi:hypothetical protein
MYSYQGFIGFSWQLDMVANSFAIFGLFHSLSILKIRMVIFLAVTWISHRTLNYHVINDLPTTSLGWEGWQLYRVANSTY